MFQRLNKKIAMKYMMALAVTVCAFICCNRSVFAASSQLKTLSVQPGNLTPAFSPDVTDYAVTVDGDVASLSIKCSKMDSEAQIVEATGFKNLSDGLNTAVIKVAASDGTTTTYTIAITKGAVTGDTNTAVTDPGTTGTEPTTDPNVTAEATENVAGILDSALAENADGVTDPLMTEGNTFPTAVDPGMGPMLVGGDDIYSTFLVCPTFDPSLLPQGFEMQDYNFRGTTIQSAYFAAGNLRLLFLTAGDGTDGDFRIYLEDEDEFYDFIQLKGTDGKFIIPTKYQAQMKIPDNYSDCFLPWGTKVIYAYCYTELTGRPVHFDNEQQNADSLEYYGFTAGEAAALQGQVVDTSELDNEIEFYLLFSINQDGQGMFYLYDSKENTFQRYVERDTSYDLDQSYFKYKDISHQRFVIMCVLAVILLIALFAILHLSLKIRALGKNRRGYDAYEDDYEEDYDGDYDDESTEAYEEAIEEPAEQSAPKKERTEKIALMGEDDWEEEPEAYDDEDEEYEDDGEYYEEEEAYEEDDQYDDEYYEEDEEEYEDEEYGDEEYEDGQYDDEEYYEDEEDYYEDDEEYEDAEDYENSIDYAEHDYENQKKSYLKSGNKVDQEKDFRMVNLSRSQLGNEIDEDFEFEFINLEDD